MLKLFGPDLTSFQKCSLQVNTQTVATQNLQLTLAQTLQRFVGIVQKQANAGIATHWLQPTNFPPVSQGK